MIPLSKPHIGFKALKYIRSAIWQNEISKGEFIEKFEKDFSKFVGYKYASACSSGTMALFLALRALGIEDGEVILPSLTFAATADAVLLAGAQPVFADINERALCLTAETVQKHITKDTKAIITVGLYGMPAKIGILKKFGVPIIEDAAESLGSDQKEKADISCYSFFGNKVLTTGEGGMACTSKMELKKKMDMLRNHGRISGFWHHMRGTNGRMSNITAALGFSQLEDLPKNLRKRRKILSWYGMSPKAVELIAPWLMVARMRDKEKTVEFLKKNGVDARIGFYPLHTMPAFKQEKSLPVSEKLGQEIIFLPCYPDLTKREVIKICNLLKE